MIQGPPIGDSELVHVLKVEKHLAENRSGKVIAVIPAGIYR
jgi:hypothetical protein